MDRQLLDYLPEVLKTYAEFRELARVEQPAVSELWDVIDDLFKEAFVTDESAAGASRWEKILEITPFDTDTIEFRNFRIHARLLEDKPYTYRTLCKQLAALCGSDGYIIKLDHDAYTLTVRVALKSKRFRNETKQMLERVVPLNLILDVDLMYNTHGIIKGTGLTRGQLAKYTHNDLREEPF